VGGEVFQYWEQHGEKTKSKKELGNSKNLKEFIMTGGSSPEE
jgi:hypothetical protein